MADLDAVKETKEYYLDIPQKSEAFYLKGSNALGWGMQNRLARIFNPKTGSSSGVIAGNLIYTKTDHISN